MSQADLRRVQTDLASMQQVLGLRSMATKADVRLFAILAAASGLLALFRWPGSPVSVPFPWAAAPIYVAIALWMGFAIIKSRTLPPREEPRKRDYRTSLIMIGWTLILTLAYLAWSRRAGIGATQAPAAMFTLFGLSLIAWPLVTPPPHRYTLPYCWAAGIPFTIFGLTFPFIANDYRHVAIGLMGFFGAGASALVLARQIRQQAAEEGESVLD